MRRTLTVIALLVGIVSVPAVAGAQSYEGDLTLGEATVTVGSTLTVVGEGFAASSEVELFLVSGSTTVPLGKYTASASGALNATVTIPSSVAPGSYTLKAVGVDSAGAPLELVGTVKVNAAGSGSGGSNSGSSTVSLSSPPR